ncbi:MAG TPA: histidine phosphatase family protein [Haliangium sp.]|nr:histidine phosphatase family protein [Haliangium sp.]
MEVLLIRHAIAAPHDAAPSDADRALTREGSKRFRQVVRGMQRLGLGLDHVFHSPWLRAVQTAELLEPVLAAELGRVLQATPLLTATPGEALLALAQGLPADARVGFVGHEPWMAELLALLVTGATAHAERLTFKKGGVAWLTGEVQPGGMTLQAMLPPRVLRRIRRPS